jgi:hypothetical protein
MGSTHGFSAAQARSQEYIALLLRDAAASKEAFKERGVSAFLENPKIRDRPKATPNTTFIANTLRQVSSANARVTAASSGGRGSSGSRGGGRGGGGDDRGHDGRLGVRREGGGGGGSTNRDYEEEEVDEEEEEEEERRARKRVKSGGGGEEGGMADDELAAFHAGHGKPRGRARSAPPTRARE